MVLLLQNVVNSHMNLLKKNNIAAPVSWEENKLAGKEWFRCFIKKYNISYRTPEATSLARAIAFNRYTVNKFFDHLASVMDRCKFTPNTIFNVDETGVTTVQSPKQVLAAKGTKQIGSITSRERGELVTLVCCISATGNSCCIFARIHRFIKKTIIKINKST